VSGRAADDDFMCSLKADILDLPLEAPEISDCELIGDALACATALGESSGMAEASGAFIKIRRRFEPGDSMRYAAGYAHFKAALEALEPIDRSEARLQ
jgi:sugar (pentulose or hexulose) kinase